MVLLVWLASGFYIVDEGQRGVVLRFGRFLETNQPGPRWHLPWPMESVEIVNVSEVRTVEVGYRNSVRTKVPNESLMLTDDENIIDLQFAVQYIRANPEEYLFLNRDADQAVMQVAESAIREVVGKNKMDFVLNEGRAQVAAKAQESMQVILDRYKTGISISQVTMQNAQPPEQVQAAFDDVNKANQDRERQKNEGQAYANDVVPKARGTAARLIQEAEGYRQRVIANAEGEASRFRQIVTEYSKAPGVTARPPLSGHDAAGACQLEQDRGRSEGRQQSAIPAARQADAIERCRKCRGRRQARRSGSSAAGSRYGGGGAALARRVPQP